MKEILLSGWTSLSSWIQTIIVCVIVVVAILTFKDLKRMVHGFTTSDDTEVRKPAGLEPVNYCSTTGRIQCVFERSPQEVKDFCKQAFDGSHKCEKKI